MALVVLGMAVQYLCADAQTDPSLLLCPEQSLVLKICALELLVPFV